MINGVKNFKNINYSYDKLFSNIIPYRSIQVNNDYYVTIDTKRYKKNECFIYYIRDFMDIYNNKIREDKLKRIIGVNENI